MKVVYPVLNLKDITFFTKINSMGAVSILFMMFFVVFNAAVFPMSNDVSLPQEKTPMPFGGLQLDTHTVWAAPGVFSLLGVLSLSFFIHNSVLSIMRNARRPENNVRDLCIAYVMCCLTYMAVGVIFFLAFKPASRDVYSEWMAAHQDTRFFNATHNTSYEEFTSNYKSCIHQNFLSNYEVTDEGYGIVVALTVLLVVQILTVLPLLFFIVRFQVLTWAFNGNHWPGFRYVAGLNAVVVAGCVITTELGIPIGSFLKYLGSFCGAVYVFAMPMLVERRVHLNRGTYTWPRSVLTWAVIGFGIVNFAGQFVAFPDSGRESLQC